MTGPRFVVDAMLGRLARWLRALGYDTLYPGPADDHRLLELSTLEERILLTRDGHLARQAGARGCLIRAEDVDTQLLETVQRLALSPDAMDWFTRCLDCNGSLEPRLKSAIRSLVPERIFDTQTEFTGCPSCGKIYWWGSHAERMQARLRGLFPRGEHRAPGP